MAANREDRESGMEETEVEDTSRHFDADRGASPLPLRGAVVDGRYRVIRLIGEGGFGWVFEVEHLLLGRNFAMKILHPRIAADPAWVRRFREEARATAAIGHECIIFVTDYGQCGQFGYYFTMEYVQGQTLAEILVAQSTIALEDVMNFAITASSALGAVHELGITHCDLKPGNVMAVPRHDGQVGWKFLDFGTSTFVLESGDSEFVYGTPAYMAPEQAVGRSVDHRADQFSLACMIYEMVTGKLPWTTNEWQDAFPEARAKRHLIPVHKIVLEMPPEFHTVLARALALEPGYRWASVEEFVEALEATVDVSSYEPTIDPMDLRQVDQAFERSLTAPKVQSLSDQPSAVIDVNQGKDLIEYDLAVTVTFQTPGRMRREWRRNLITGGLYVAGEQAPDLRKSVLVELVYAPSHDSIQLPGTVVSHSRQTGGGFGIGFDNKTTELIRKFVSRLSLGLGVRQEDIVQRGREADECDALSAGEAYVLGRLGVFSLAGRLRAKCSGLPFDYDEVLEQLFDKGLVQIQDASVESEYTDAEVQEGSKRAEIPHMDFTTLERHRIVEMVEYFVSQDNYIGAVDLMEKALQLSADNVDLRYRLALVYSSVLNKPESALKHLEKGLAREPEHAPSQRLWAHLSA